MADLTRGDIWLADLDPTRGHEQAGRRPVLVVSDDRFHQGLSGLVFGAPLTTRARNLPFHVAVSPPEAGLRTPSYIMCEQTRSIARERLIQRWGAVSPTTLTTVEDRLRILLAL